VATDVVDAFQVDHGAHARLRQDIAFQAGLRTDPGTVGGDLVARDAFVGNTELRRRCRRRSWSSRPWLSHVVGVSCVAREKQGPELR
jgi:hypothetical protein